MNDVDLQFLFRPPGGGRGDTRSISKVLMSEEEFKKLLSDEGIRLKAKEMEAITNHFWDQLSGTINCGLIVPAIEQNNKQSSKIKTEKDWDGKSTQPSDKLEI